MSDQHRIRRIRLALGTDYPQAAGLTDRTRRLFHLRIRGLLDRLLQQASLPGQQLKAEQIVVELGDLPEAHFEEELCRRLMRLLPGILHQQLRGETSGMPRLVQPEMPRAGISDNRTGRSVSGSGARIYEDNTEESSSSCCKVLVHYVRTAIWTRTQSPDCWLSVQLTQYPASLSSLAEICLQMPQLGLSGRFFREKTLRELIRKLAPGESEQQPASPGTVLCAALHWYQSHSAVPVPAFPQSRHWPDMSLSDAGADSILPQLTRPELQPWRRTLQYRLPSTKSLRDDDTAYLVDGLAGALTQKQPTDIYEKTAHSRIKKTTTFPSSLPDSAVTSRAPASPVPGRADGRQHVSHAGLALLWPLLPELLQITGIRQQHARMDEYQRQEAVVLLAYLAEGKVSDTVSCTAFSHWLCDVSPEHTQTLVPLSAERAEKVDLWLQTLPERIPGWQRLSAQDIRTLFLQREGWLCHDSHTLYLPPQPADILLAQWPWPLTIMLLPWLQTPLTLSLSLPPQK